jgi:HSP20 family protein
MFGLMPWRTAERRLGREAEPPFGLMRRDLASLLERFFPSWPAMLEPFEEVIKDVEIVNKEKEVLVRAEVPGFEPAEVIVEVTGNLLTIRAEHKPKEVKPETPEEFWSKFERTILLPVTVEPEKIEAVCKNGILEVTLPKKPEAVTRRIEVRT